MINTKIINALYKREVESKPIQNVKFHAAFASLLIATMFFLGIKPSATTLMQNIKTNKELSEIKSSMTQKIRKINDEETRLARLVGQVDLLYKKIPEEEALDKYLKELVILSSKNGFYIERLGKTDTHEKNTVNLQAILTGNVTSLPNLVSSIEESDRFSSIRKIYVSKGEESTKFRISLSIHYL